MTLNYYRCGGGQRILDIHHGGRVVASFHFWPWLVRRRWKFEVWRGSEGTRYYHGGPFELTISARRKQ